MAGDAKTKKMMAFGAVSLLCAGGLILMFLFFPRPAKDILSLSGLEDSSQIETRFEQAGNIIALTQHEADSFRVDASQVRPGNYIVTANIASDKGYKDIRFGLDRSAHKIIIVAGGFHPQESFTVETTGIDDLDDLHFDWSGRIEISRDLPEKQKHGTVCLKTEAGFSACHTYDVRGQT